MKSGRFISVTRYNGIHSDVCRVLDNEKCVFDVVNSVIYVNREGPIQSSYIRTNATTDISCILHPQTVSAAEGMKMRG